MNWKIFLKSLAVAAGSAALSGAAAAVQTTPVTLKNVAAAAAAGAVTATIAYLKQSPLTASNNSSEK